MTQRFALLLLTSSFLFSLVLISCGDNADGGESDSTFTERMAKEHDGDKPTGNDVAWLEPSQPVKTDDVAYGPSPDSTFAGFMAWPAEGEKPTSGLIVIHEWWGLNDNIQAMTKRLAGEGYMALSVDLYNDKVAESSDSARAYMEEAMSNPEQRIDHLRAAINYLKEHGVSKVGVIGWCFGGAWSLRTALNFPDEIDATVIYYGHLDTNPEELKKLKMPVLGIFGEEDQGIPVEQVKRFEAVLDSLGADADITIYPNASHAFANPSGERYNAEAAKDAWGKTVEFLEENL